MAADTQGFGPWAMKDVEVRVACEAGMWDPGPFVISRYDENRNPG
jgi:hypothetical protein